MVESSSSLAGQRVVITRARHQMAPLRRLLEVRGAEVIELPMIELAFVRGDLGAKADQLLTSVATTPYDALLVTSANTVQFLFERCEALGIDAAAQHYFAVGPATAQALRERGVREVLVATEAVGEGLVKCVLDHFGNKIAGRRLLLPRAKEAREVVVEELVAHGATVDVAVLYETIPVTTGPGLPPGKIHWLTFASPSAVHAFAKRFALPAGVRIAVIGPVTADAVREVGWSISAMPQEHTIAAMVEAMSRN